MHIERKTESRENVLDKKKLLFDERGVICVVRFRGTTTTGTLRTPRQPGRQISEQAI